jgi:hypothetical protein
VGRLVCCIANTHAESHTVPACAKQPQTSLSTAQLSIYTQP